MSRRGTVGQNTARAGPPVKHDRVKKLVKSRQIFVKTRQMLVKTRQKSSKLVELRQVPSTPVKPPAGGPSISSKHFVARPSCEGRASAIFLFLTPLPCPILGWPSRHLPWCWWGLGIVLSTGGMSVLGGCAVLRLYKVGADYAVK